MRKYIELLNTKPMLWISGLFLLGSFILQYILPIIGSDFTLPINPAWVSVIISGIPLAYYAVVNTLGGRITSPLLITIAMIAAIYIGDVFAAGEVAFIMAIGEWLEDKTVERAKKGIESLLGLVPTQGRLIIAENGGTTERVVPAQDLQVGDIIRILPGETFAADGEIIAGTTTADQSIMTGESLPVDKEVGDTVFTGTINRFGSVDVRVTKAFADSSLQKMIHLVKQAEDNKAPTQKIVDKWAGWLVPLACVIAIITYIVFTFGLNMPDEALVRAVTVLVVFCPCALALATPTSIMAAIGQATKYGVLIKSGEALENMGKIHTVAFDKTGTLTHGKLTVSDVISYDLPEGEFLSLVASVEARSEHPIGKAVVEHAKKQNLSTKEVENFAMEVGKGVSAIVEGKTIMCGNEKMFTSQLTESSQRALQDADGLREQGKAVVIISDGQTVYGVIGLSDTLKEEAGKAIKKLADAGVHRTILLTGDNPKAATYIANKVGITEVYASLLPKGKVETIEMLSKTNPNICMVGDGVNDAPALKTASVGIAMGTMGSDIAIDAADIALMGDDISKIGYIKKLSNATVNSIQLNITLSMVINFGAIILSVMGLLNPASGALVHNAGSVLVVLNAARLYDRKLI